MGEENHIKGHGRDTQGNRATIGNERNILGEWVTGGNIESDKRN